MGSRCSSCCGGGDEERSEEGDDEYRPQQQEGARRGQRGQQQRLFLQVRTPNFQDIVISKTSFRTGSMKYMLLLSPLSLNACHFSDLHG